MLSARYGRMKVGRCVQVEPGFEAMLEDRRYLGCLTDVLDVVSRRCSGRSECSLRVNDQTFDNVHSCYTSLKMYLEVAYICVSGELSRSLVSCLVESEIKRKIDYYYLYVSLRYYLWCDYKYFTI